MPFERASEHPRCWNQRLWWVGFVLGLTVAYFVLRQFQMNFWVFAACLLGFLSLFCWGASRLGKLIDQKWRSEGGLRRQHRRQLKLMHGWLRRVLRRRGDRLEAAVFNRLERAIAETGEILENRQADSRQLLEQRRRLEVFIDEHLRSFRKSQARESFESLLVVLAAALALRLFVIEPFQIPSGSMIPTLRVGDHIFVNKLSYGVRVPLLPLRIFGKRIPPLAFNWSMPQRGDVIVFITPENEREDYIKRVVALPGDRVEVKNGMLWLNGKPTELDAGEGFSYVDLDEEGNKRGEVSAKKFREILDTRRHELLRRACRNDYDCPIVALPHCQFSGTPPSAECEVRPSAGCDTETGLCRQTEFGPYVVPEGYVFAMGDNRDNSRDSRVWGPVPLDLIKGRAFFIWWSYREGMVQWERMFTSIN